MLLAEHWIIARLRHERFGSLVEANPAIASFLEWIGNPSFKKIDGSRVSLFQALDRGALRPVP